MAEQGINRGSNPPVILVGTDLSDLDRLMVFALDQASRTWGRLILLHVIANPAGLMSPGPGASYYDPWSAVEFAERQLEPWCSEARHYGIPCDAIVREGQAGNQIGAAARQFQAQLIILGTRDRSKMSKMLIGSVAEQVLRSVNLPVMTVGPEAHLPVQSGFEEHLVLHATTLREASRPSAVLACRFAQGLKAKLVLLHVLPPMDELQRKGQPAGWELAAREELRILAEQTVADCGLQVEPVVIHGNPSIEILAEASQRKADLIVLGATHRSAFENLTRDHTVYRVLAHARCPVVTLREPEADWPDAGQEDVVTSMFGS
jgi:nucleotide-binding universal stress UspA family protein